MVKKTSHSTQLIKELEEIAKQLRINVIEMVYRRGQGHPGGSLSPAEIISALFFHHLRIDPDKPDWENRDRFILSKGHACSLFYAALAKRGYFPTEELKTWGCIGSRLQGHPDRLKTPGVDMTTGCLGHGINIAAGLCLAGQIKGLDYHTYVLIGDGECQAGILWEGIMLAAKYKLSKLTTILDYNEVQLDGRVEEIMPLEPIKDKWKAFNWAILEINGHDMKEVLDSLESACDINDKPTVIIAHTTKGKGVSFMEGKAQWHGRAPNENEYKQALEELRKK
ncbi:MAG: transketolase [Candidatus Omnitrophota bacterium]